MRRVLITGASGFIGRSLSGFIATARPSWEVLGLDRREGASTRQVNLSDAPAVTRILADFSPDIVFHLAGMTGRGDLGAMYAANVENTVTLFEALLVSAPHARVIMPGSAAEYGAVPVDGLPISESLVPEPISPYGLSKLWQTSLHSLYARRGLSIAVGRIFNISGRGVPTTSVLGSAAAQLRRAAADKSAQPLRFRWLGSVRDFLDIEDVCSALVALAETDANGVYNVCSGVPVTVRDVLQRLVELSGCSCELVEESDGPSAGEIAASFGTNARLRGATGWEPLVTLDDSLRRTLS